MYQLTTPEIESMLKSCREFNALCDDDKEVFDWLDPSFQQGITKKDVIASLIDLLVKWYFYMKKYEIAQEYELCANIRDVIDMEVDDARRVIARYFIIEEDDYEMFKMLKEESKKKVYENYYNWLKFLEDDDGQ